MKAIEIRKLKIADIQKKIDQLETDFLELRCQHGVGTLENSSLLKKKRKEIAVVKTVYNELKN